jgi:streptogramin lyase
LYTQGGTYQGYPYYVYNGNRYLFKLLGASWILNNELSVNPAYTGDDMTLEAGSWRNITGTPPGPSIIDGNNLTPTYTLAAGSLNISGYLTVGDGVHPVVAQTNTNDPNLYVTGNFILSSQATFEASNSATFDVAGNFTNSGMFSHNSGTVNLTGATAPTQVVSGSTTFYNLTIPTTTGARIVQFAGSSTQTITGTWTVTGATGQLITLALKTGDTGTWNINPTNWSVSYVNVSNSTNHASSIINPSSSIDSGGNANWFTVVNYNITASTDSNGTISPLGATAVASGGTQAYIFSANSSYQIATVVVDGAAISTLTSPYTFTNVTTVHTISITTVASNTCVWEGLGIGSNWSTTMNWSGDTAPTSSCNVVFNSTSNTPSTIDSGFTNHIKSFAVNTGYTNTITVSHDLNDDGAFTLNTGTFTARSNTLNIGGSLYLAPNPTAIFNANTSTVNLDGSGTPTITTNSQNLYNMTVNGASSVISTPDIWVSNYDNTGATSTITKINTSTGDIMGAYDVGVSLPYGVAMDTSGNVWVANNGDGTVTKLNGSTGATMGTYTVGTYPVGVAIDASGNVWVANNGDGTVTKLNGSSGDVMGTYSVGSCNDLAVDSSGNVWVTSTGAVTELNGSSGDVMGTYSTGSSYPDSIAVDASGHIWTGNSSTNNVTKLNGSTGGVIGNYNVGNTPTGITVDGSGDIWVTNYNDNTVTKLNGSSGAPMGTYGVGSGPNGLAMDASGHVWVANSNDNTVIELNGSTGASMGIYDVGATPIIFGDATSFALQKFVLGGSGTSADYTLSGGLNITNNLAVSSSTLTAGANTVTTVNFNQTGGAFVAPSVNMNVTGNFSNTGTFSSNLGTVNLSGSGTQIISGSTSFYNLSATSNPGRTIKFTSGTTQTVTGIWTVTGANGQNITLSRDNGSGTDQWNINPTAWSISYVTVSNSNNQAASKINPANSTDGGNNSNWFMYPPNAANNVSITNMAQTGFSVNWTDNSSDETGFKVYTTGGAADCSTATYSGTPDYTTAVNTTTQAISGKAVNSQYCAKVVATNTVGDATPAYSNPIYTLANTPTAPSLGTPTSTSIPVVINRNSNPANTTYSVKVVQGVSTNYLKIDGTLSATPVFDTSTNFGGASGVTNIGLASNSQYTYSVAAKNGDGTVTSYGSTATSTTLPTYTVTASTGANGAISPLGVTTVASGATQVYTFSGNSSYSISSLIIDGAAQETLTSPYTFTNITANHTISVTFAINTSCVWTGLGTDSKWSTSTNWSGNSIPTSTCDVVFDNTGNTASTLDSGFTNHIKSLSVNTGYTSTITAGQDLNDDGAFSLNSGIFTAGSYTLNIGGALAMAASPTATFNANTSTINLDGSGNLPITTNGQSLYNMTVNGNVISTPYVWVPSNGSITKLNTADGSLVGTYNIGSNQWGIAVDDSGNVWVGNGGNGNTVTEINGVTNQIIGSYSVGSAPYGVAVDASDNVWITNYVDRTVTKLNGSTGVTIGTYAAGVNPRGIAVDASGNAWITNFGPGGTVTEINGNTGAAIGSYNVGANPTAVAVDASGNIWVANLADDSVTKLNGANGSVLGTYSVGASHPRAIAVDGSGYVWVTNELDNTVTKLNGATGAIVGIYDAGSSPYGIAVDASGNIWVANFGFSTVTKLNGATGAVIGAYSVGNHTGVIGDMTGFALQKFVLGTYTLAGNLTVSNNLAINNGTLTSGANTVNTKNYNQTGGNFNAPSGNMNVTGNFSDTAGIFNNNFGTVNLSGSGAQVVTGSTSFYNLSTTTSSARTIQFGGTSTQTVIGTWTATGIANNLLSLVRKSGDSGIWSINPTAWNVDYVNVANSTNLASSVINPTHYSPATLASNNTNWFNYETVTVSSSGSGTVTPNSTVSILKNTDQTFTLSPASHYHISSILLDDISQTITDPTGMNFTLTNLIANHTLNIIFSINTNNITVSTGQNGSVSPSSSVAVNYGNDQTFSIAANTHFHISDVSVDNVSVGAVSSYTFTNVIAPHTIAVTFSVDTNTITVSAGANGVITPAGAVVVDYGSDQYFTITPDNNYGIADVLVDGTSAGAVSSYNFTAVTAPHTIAATFNANSVTPITPSPTSPKTYKITASAGTGGIISPSGVLTVDAKDNKKFTITPNSGYYISNIEIDGVGKGSLTNYTFSNITSNHSIEANFNAYPTSIDNPTNFVGSAGNSQTVLNWTNPTSAYFSHVDIYRSIESGTLGSQIASGGNSTYTDLGLTNGKTYYYTLKAADSLGNVSTGTEQLALTPVNTIDTQPPTVPTNLRTTDIKSTQINLAWDASTDNVGVAGYKLFNADTGVMIDSTQKTTYILTNLTPNTTYNFYVEAYDSAGNVSDKSAPLSVLTSSGSQPAMIANLVLTNVPSQINAGQKFNNPVKVTAVDMGGAKITTYVRSVYFTSTDTKAELNWNKNHAYKFTSDDGGVHLFYGSDFKLNTAGSQRLTVTDGATQQSVQIKVLSTGITESLQKAQNSISNLFANATINGLTPVSSKVSTAAVVVTSSLLAAPIIMNLGLSMISVWPQIFYFLTHLLQFLGLRRRRKPWGTVFNSQSGQPITYALVKIFDQEYNRLLETTVTDNEGRFGFLVKTGNFYVTVQKNGYNFPSETKVSGFFDSVYNGGTLKIDEKDKTVTLNIPLDPQSKVTFAYKFSVIIVKLNRIFSAIRVGLLVVGILLAITLMIFHINLLYILSLTFYILIAIWEYLRTRRARPYGVVTDFYGRPLETAIVRIYEKRSNRLIETDVTDIDGRFKFLVNPGVYYLTATKPEYTDFKSHIMYLEKERTMVSSDIKMKKAG